MPVIIDGKGKLEFNYKNLKIQLLKKVEGKQNCKNRD